MSTNFNNTPNLPFKYKILLFSPLLAGATALYFFVFHQHYTFLYGEHQLMENIQVILIFTSGFFFILQSTHIEKQHYWFTLTLTLLCYGFFLRELDIEDFNVPNILIELGSGTGRNIMLAVGWLFSIAYFVKHWEQFKTQLIPFLMSTSGRLLMISAFLLVFGGLFDRKLIIMDHAVFFEELAEMAAYYCILVSALLIPLSFHAIKESFTTVKMKA